MSADWFITQYLMHSFFINPSIDIFTFLAILYLFICQHQMLTNNGVNSNQVQVNTKQFRLLEGANQNDSDTEAVRKMLHMSD